MNLKLLCRRLTWLWSGSHTSRLAQLIYVVLVVRVIMALHCNPQVVFCDGHSLMHPLHNNGTKIGMGSEQSYEPQLTVSKAYLLVVWLSYLQTRPAHLRCLRRPCHRGHRCSQDCLFGSAVLRAETRPPGRIASHDYQYHM